MTETRRSISLVPPRPPWLLLLALVAYLKWIYDFWAENYRLSNAFIKSPFVRREARHWFRTTWLSEFTGRPSDLSDGQYRPFREALLILLPAYTAMVLIRRLLPPQYKTAFGALFAVVFVFIAHGVSGFIIMTSFVLVNYLLILMFPRWLWTNWVFCLAVLYACRTWGGFFVLQKYLDGFGQLPIDPLLPWHWAINLVVLKMISLASDCRQGLIKNLTLPELFFYLFYPPLYLSGPTYVAEYFIADIRAQSGGPAVPASVPREPLLSYVVRFIVVFVISEIFSNFLYINALQSAIGLNAGGADQDRFASFISSVGLSADDYTGLIWMSFGTLFCIWFRFIIIWRWSRLWALLDGVNAPENMRRCVANNYTIKGFWRDWHSSFNLWLVRYIYIPVGGSRHGILRQILAVATVFAFTAAWHDWWERLFAWGGLFSLFMAPEILLTRWSNKGALALRIQNQSPHLWDALEACAGGVCILGLEVANMVGFSLGLGATTRILGLLTSTPDGLLFTLKWFLWMWVIAFWMVKQRRWERESKASKND